MGMAPPAAFYMRRVRLLGAIITGSVLWVGCQQVSPTQNASARCASCHLSEFEATSDPPHVGVRPKTCGVCHLADSWHPYRLKHNWPLQGAHAKAKCFACHTGKPPQFEGTSRDCLSCHKAAKDKANAAVLHHASFPVTCDKCHTTNAWKPTLPHHPPPPPSNSLSAPPQANEPTLKRHAAAADLPRKLGSAKPKPVAISPAPVVNRPAPDVVSGASPVRHK
jgi:hypothetical protein